MQPENEAPVALLEARPVLLARPDRRRGGSLAALTAYGYILPAAVILGIWHVLPILYVIYLSFTRSGGAGLFGRPWAGLVNYQRLLHDPQIRDALVATVEFLVGTVPTGAILALALALLLFDRLPGIGFFRTLVLLPFITPVVATTVVWQWIFNPQYGVIDSLLYALHLPQVDWPASPFWSMVILCAYTLWHDIGFTVLIMLAGLATIDQEVREAARIDGAGPWHEFLSITMPLMSPWILVVIVLNSIGAFKVFTQVLLLTNGGPGNATTIAGYLIEKTAFTYFDLPYASAISIAVLILVSALTLFQFSASRRTVFYQ